MNPTLARLTRFVGNYSHQSDGSLLAAFISGNQLAFRELVERHGSLVFGVCNRILRHQQDAEDAFQAVFLVLARRAADVWPQDAVGSWLFGVASRVAVKARTLRTRRLRREESSSNNNLKQVAQPEVELIDRDIVEAIDRVVRKLPEVYRAAVVACDLEGLSRKDAAGRLGWTEGTLSGRLSRARKLLADRLRKSRIAFPAIGLSAFLGTQTQVRAGLSESVMKLVSATSEISTPVQALTQGVVESMFAFKLKTAAATLLVACTLGIGAWTAGAGDDPGKQESSGDTPFKLPQEKVQKPDLDKIRSELRELEQELNLLTKEGVAQKGNFPESLAKRVQVAEEKLRALRQLLTESREQQKPVHVPPTPLNLLNPGLNDLQGKWKIESLREGKSVQKMDPKVEYVMEISGNTLFMPYREGDGTMKRKEYKIAVDASRNPKTINLTQPTKPNGAGIYEFVASTTTCTLCHKHPFDEEKGSKDLVAICNPAIKYATGLRLAIAMNGPQPAKFGGAENVLEFQLSREGKELHFQPDKPYPPYEKLMEAFLLEQERHSLRETREAGAAVHQAQYQLAIAEAQMVQAKANLEATKAQVEVAMKKLEEARARVSSLEKQIAPPKRMAPIGEAQFSVHIRTQFATEKVIRVKSTGSQTVLEGLAYAAEDMAINPEAVSVWVVREKGMLPVDLAAITQKGEAKTNYQLKPGDQLFVQVKIGK